MENVGINSEVFKPYGIVINETQVSSEGRLSLMEYFMAETEAPETGNVYVADELPIHDKPVAEEILEVLDYDQPQFGYCHGHNTKVNALEWHDCHELILAVTDCVLFLGHPKKMTVVSGKLNFNTKDLIAIELKAGEMILLKPRVLHFAPVKVTNEPFRTMIVLDKGTNTPLEVPGDHHLFMVNKWLITHADRQDLVDKGAHPGVVGQNYDWNEMQSLRMSTEMNEPLRLKKT